ncbi:hypothetical protein Curi_c00610 [Gottschalkia acidurici 9a]|uniref:Bacteriocin-associated integral membrane protein n=1 Tax=Gottschalkia acidurici (strain ATCC 7906 / DSM 604 / BCRC 14475 / CIP 104303 / KCTC 5404 / NCIMB 10678 / 9a) TaxID=1128398 RepID=K0AWK2_GOTA9|nr:hypothetical protein [Gottschalkia acidurici]AFS77142.1 hypothetical protein Curi_c00610 [Gottschalkia acidurici 9a]
MKKTYRLLILLFFILFTIIFTKYYGMYESSRIFTGRYDASIHLTIVEDISKEDVLSTLEDYGKRYDMDIERAIAFPGDGKNRKSLTAYVSINDFDWFNGVLSIKGGKKLNSNLKEGEFLSNIDTKDKKQVGRFSIFDDSSREIYIRPLSDMKNRLIETDYKLHLNNDRYTLNEVISTINSEQKSFSVKESSVNSFVDMNEYSIYSMYYIIILLFFILFLGILLFLYEVIGRSKSFGIKKLYGYSDFKIVSEIFKEDILKVIALSNISSILFITISLYFKNGLAGFKQYISIYLLLICAVDIILMIIMTVIVSLFKGKDNIQLMLKGKRRNIILLNTIMKIMMSIIVILTLTLNLNTFNNYKAKSDNLENWDKARNLGFIGFKFPGDAIDTIISFYPYEVKLGSLWNDINDNGGIMAGYQQLVTNDIIEKERIQPNLAYMMLVNENYLKENTVLDENGDRIREIDDDEDTVTVLVPSQFKNKEKLLKDSLRYIHLGHYDLVNIFYKEALEIKEGKRKSEQGMEEFKEYLEKEYSFLKQKIIYTANDQRLFTYDTGEMNLYRKDFKGYYNDIDKTITDPILFIMTNDNLKENLKVSSLTSGTMKFRFEDYKYPEDGIVPLLEKHELLDSLVVMTTVYDYAVDDINNTKTMLMLSGGISVSCILIILGLIFYESTSYLYRNRKKIGVLKLYGLNFLNRYKSYFIMISAVDLIIIIISTIIGQMYLKRFVAISTKVYYLIITIGILFYLLELIITYLYLSKKEDKSILDGLKGEL